jgi:Electron transfer DM13
MMKMIFSKWMKSCILIATFVSCSKEKIPVSLNEPSPVNGGTIIRSAGFLSDQRSTGGIVRYVINNGKRYLVFENFSTGVDNGLRVYLSKNVSNDQVQDLGRLKAFKGNFSYELPGGFDPLTYNTVLIWQFAFGDLYGHATLN